jgi:hypothetical protein
MQTFSVTASLSYDLEDGCHVLKILIIMAYFLLNVIANESFAKCDKVQIGLLGIECNESKLYS